MYRRVKFRFRGKNIKLSYKNKVDKEIHVLADAQQFKKVINNIIMNSVKFIKNEKGLIHIYIEDKNEFVQIGIKDNGIGISMRICHMFLIVFIGQMNPEIL